MEPVSIEEVEKINIVVVRNLLQEQERRRGVRRDPYAVEVDKGRNCYSCREFGYLVRNCIIWSIVDQERRVEYRENLKEKESLVVLN